MIKMKIFLRALFVLALVAVPHTVGAQITNIPIGEQNKINTDSVIKDFDQQPFFGIYKDN